MLENVSIVGSGSWATALVKVFSESGVCVNWLVRDEILSDQIKASGRNPRYLSYVDLDLRYVNTFTKIDDALDSSEAVIFALPASYIQNIFPQIETLWLEEKLLITSIKGFVPNTGSIPSHYVEEHSGQYRPVITMGGPCHAEEIAAERSTYMTVAGENQDDVQLLCQSLKVKYIQTIKNNDPTGVEYVAIIKNIIAIASGIASGLNYGENFQSVLISNAMREVQSFLRVMDPMERDLFDSAYFGDLLVTAYSDYSRNKTLGKLIGRGIKTGQAMQSMTMIAEGYNASRELHEATNDLNIPLPIINSVYRILHQHANPYREFKLIEKQLR